MVQGQRDEAAEKEKVVTQLRAELRDQGPILSALEAGEGNGAAARRDVDQSFFMQEIEVEERPCRRAGERARDGRGRPADPAAVEKVAEPEGPDDGVRIPVVAYSCTPTVRTTSPRTCSPNWWRAPRAPHARAPHADAHTGRAEAEELGGTVVGDASTVVKGVAGIREAQPSDIAFIANSRYDAYLHRRRRTR